MDTNRTLSINRLTTAVEVEDRISNRTIRRTEMVNLVDLLVLPTPSHLIIQSREPPRNEQQVSRHKQRTGDAVQKIIATHSREQRIRISILRRVDSTGGEAEIPWRESNSDNWRSFRR